jgi:hypothetical protein
MAATFAWEESNGAGAGGTTTSTTSTVNWKSVDDNSGTAYTAAPITAGNNSYEKWQYGHFSGSFNQILNGKWAHTATNFGAGLTLKASKAMTADGDRTVYTTPSAVANTTLTQDMTSTLAIGSGAAVWFGAGSAHSGGKAASMTTNPCYTNYLTTQLQTTTSASAGDTAQVTITLSYDEN